MKINSNFILYAPNTHTHTVPVTEITGDSDRYVKAGSNVTLTCIVSAYIDAPRFIIWYQDATKIMPENYRGVITEEKKFNNSSPISVRITHSFKAKF